MCKNTVHACVLTSVCMEDVYCLVCWLPQVGEVMTDLGRSHSMRDRDDLLAEQVSYAPTLLVGCMVGR